MTFEERSGYKIVYRLFFQMSMSGRISLNHKELTERSGPTPRCLLNMWSANPTPTESSGYGANLLKLEDLTSYNYLQGASVFPTGVRVNRRLQIGPKSGQLSLRLVANSWQSGGEQLQFRLQRQLDGQ